MAEEHIVQREIQDEMKQSYLDYAMSVLVSRALPDVRDGLKPVQRRILYTMHRLGLTHGRAFRKSATIVGNTMARYHPHGDAAIYDALVRLAQDFSLRYPLVDGQGNWGSIDGDKAAAFRYTEARMQAITEELLADIDKATVEFIPNFDSSTKEPIVLPGKIPNLLVNGASGIAVGMATNIPPHNLNEVADAIIAQIDNPEVEVDELMQYLPGPDFPTGGIIRGRGGILAAYKNGRGIVKVRSKTAIEEKNDRTSIIVSEIPYMINKSLLLEEIADLVRNKVIPDIADIRDESDREGMRIVIMLKKNANSTIVLNQLFSHSRLETSIPIALIALVNGRPRTLSIREVIQGYIDHRREVVTRRSQFELRKAQERLHIVDGLLKALASIDEVVATIKSSRDASHAREQLVSLFDLSEVQATAVLDMRLQKLSSLETQQLRDEGSQLREVISYLQDLLASPGKIMNVVKTELSDVRGKYGDARRTIIEDAGDSLVAEDLIKPEDMVVTITHSGYVKRTPLAEYRQQQRGGKGVIAATTKEGDFVEHVFTANTHSYLLFFTNRGIVHWLKVYEIPDAGRSAVGKAVVNLLNLSEDEKVTAFVNVKEFLDDHFLVTATKNGTIKKTSLSAYSNPRKGGIIAITLEEGDELIRVVMTDDNQEIILASRNGNAVRFKESDIRSSGRSAKGVRGIRLRDDVVVGMEVADESKDLLTVCENGFGKRTPVSEYRLTSRGGVGVINIQTSERNGLVVGIASVSDSEELMFISRLGIIIRVSAAGISRFGRNTQGSRIMRLRDSDRVVAVAKIEHEEE